ncbi:MAG: hypothetical protein QM582_01885 [Micropruina sp.]|uniref:hypothetical protein n=1 Tax=Micropruina sp. TaxID=2737536 RepID=UPI0039E50F26
MKDLFLRNIQPGVAEVPCADRQAVRGHEDIADIAGSHRGVPPPPLSDMGVE